MILPGLWLAGVALTAADGQRTNVYVLLLSDEAGAMAVYCRPSHYNAVYIGVYQT